MTEEEELLLTAAIIITDARLFLEGYNKGHVPVQTVTLLNLEREIPGWLESWSKWRQNRGENDESTI